MPRRSHLTAFVAGFAGGIYASWKIYSALRSNPPLQDNIWPEESEGIRPGKENYCVPCWLGSCEFCEHGKRTVYTDSIIECECAMDKHMVRGR